MLRAPKYSCTICNKTFRRSKQHYSHVNRAHRNTKRGTKQIVQQVELKTIESQPYFGREYNFVNIPTGNRHLRAGIPLPQNNWTPRQPQQGIWVSRDNKIPRTIVPGPNNTLEWSPLTLKTLDKHYITGAPRLPLLGSWSRRLERAPI